MMSQSSFALFRAAAPQRSSTDTQYQRSIRHYQDFSFIQPHHPKSRCLERWHHRHQANSLSASHKVLVRFTPPQRNDQIVILTRPRTDQSPTKKIEIIGEPNRPASVKVTDHTGKDNKNIHVKTGDIPRCGFSFHSSLSCNVSSTLSQL